ncbi:MAG: sugar phosphate isomerase/epimerase [Clostridiales bacterium]|nr:sugar phosphate isomerase/epimerase [Clostridiales bacterium]
MNYGMRCHDICKKGDIDTVLDAVKENGIHQIQLALGKSFAGYNFEAGHYSPGFAHMIADKLKARDIHVAILGCYINPTDPDETRRKASIAKFIEHLKYCKIIGADMVGTETGRYSSDFHVCPETYTETCYNLLLKSMWEIVDAAEKLGVTVGVEAVHDHTLYSPEMMRRFLDDIDSPNVEAIFDPINLISAENYTNQEAVIGRAFDLYGDQISMVHMKDFVMVDGEPQFARVNDGLFHYEPCLKWLKQNKPYITILLESADPKRYDRDVAYLQKIYGEV